MFQEDGGIIPDGRKMNRIEEFVRQRKSGDIEGQQMRITVRYMKERRKKRWEREYNWLEQDLDRLIDSCEVNPEDLQDFSLPLVLVGSDVASLYPNLDAEKVAELVYNAVLKSEIKWSNIDYFEAARYLALNWSEEQCRSSKLRRILPTRRGKTGTRPGVRGSEWKFRPDINLTEAEKKELIARVVEVAVAMMFQTHVYGFGGNTIGRPQAGQ